MRVHRSRRRGKEVRALAQPSGSGHCHPAHRVDHAPALHRRSQRQPGSGPAVQEFAQASLARRVPAYQDGYVDRRRAGRDGHGERDRPGVRGVCGDRRLYRHWEQAAGGVQHGGFRHRHRQKAQQGRAPGDDRRDIEGDALDILGDGDDASELSIDGGEDQARG